MAEKKLQAQSKIRAIVILAIINVAIGGLWGILFPFFIVALSQISRRYRNDDSRLDVFLAVSILVALVSLARLANYLSEDNPPAQQITNSLDALNQNLPMMVDDGLRLESYEGEGNVLVMNITTVGMDAEEIDIDSWMSESKSRVEHAACADPNYRQILESGVIYEYRYRDEDGIPVVTVQLSHADCR